MPKSARMKYKNQNQNRFKENQTIIVEPATPTSLRERVAIGELLTLTEIEAVITQHVVLSNAAATALVVCSQDDDFN